jgi:predicted unusual protein kinase regulating ubiquinone biosynthesis (AarF/ABC1/UbiB family)
MADVPRLAALATGRLGRFASLARAGLGTAASVAMGSSSGVEFAVERLGELRGIGTKVGQMAGLVEANLDPAMRARVGPALAKLRAQAASSPYEAIAEIVREDLGALPDELFASFEREPFASASLGQVHLATSATSATSARLAVKVQHPGIQKAFRGDLENVTALGRMATSFIMPENQGKAFIESVKSGFLAELDYAREADNLALFARLLAGDPDLEVPSLIADRSSARVLTATFLRGDPVEVARGYDAPTRRRQAAAVRRLVLSALTDHGALYADAHAGNFLFRADGTVGVLDFGSVFLFDEPQREAFAALRDAAVAGDRAAFTLAVERAHGAGSDTMIGAVRDVQWLAFGGLARGEAISDAHVRAVASAIGDLKRKMLGSRMSLPPFMPFLMRTLLATSALMAALDAPDSGPVGRLSPPPQPTPAALGMSVPKAP